MCIDGRMFVNVNGIRLGYDDHGKGEPVVLIGGFGANRSLWDEAVSMMDGYRVITYDNRGVGETEYGGAFTIDDLADDAVSLLDVLGISRAHVVGWSMGSHVGQSLGLRYADRIKSLTLVSTYSRLPSRSGYILGGLNGMALRGEAPMACLAMAVNAFCFPEETFREFEEEGREFPIPDRLEAPRGLGDQLRAMSDYDTRDRVSGIGVPTMVVHGGKDIMVEPKEGMAVADAIDGSRFLLIEAAGHSIPFGMYWEQVRAFMDSNA